ncbi:arginine repressor [Enterococcus mediterraneensis]|uniref:arginine repressor n=1 Tax=Enterococcus mediterraneensis TaxID=2364791 RepID=UPI000F05FC12|nr:ArgR family transcriptional regulator [Enterococcus mediterraneensis]
MRKADRHLLIKQIISNQTVRTQEELLRLLEKKGVSATQATISRDIRDLKIIKAPDETGQARFEIFQGDRFAQDGQEEERRLIHMIEDVVTKVDRVQFLTIVNTLPDNAQLITALIDEVDIPEKVTTLAGFDTVIIISRTEEDAKKIERYFRAHILA